MWYNDEPLAVVLQEAFHEGAGGVAGGKPPDVDELHSLAGARVVVVLVVIITITQERGADDAASHPVVGSFSSASHRRSSSSSSWPLIDCARRNGSSASTCRNDCEMAEPQLGLRPLADATSAAWWRWLISLALLVDRLITLLACSNLTQSIR
uniref:Uncharacterized protein n=1 Tax=Oryza meridionalis TaxID=40149 RepID=A0A0E0CJL0_9ORYZ